MGNCDLQKSQKKCSKQSVARQIDCKDKNCGTKKIQSLTGIMGCIKIYKKKIFCVHLQLMGIALWFDRNADRTTVYIIVIFCFLKPSPNKQFIVFTCPAENPVNSVIQSRLVTTLRKKAFENFVGNGENAGYQHFFLFPQYFLSSKQTSFFGVAFILSSANALNFD